MQNHQDDPDSTMFFRPASLAMAAAAQPVSGIDVRQIGALGAINPLMSAANSLLMMVPTLRTASQPSNVTSLRTRLIEMIKDFDAATVKLGTPDEQRNIARYGLCTVIDEAIQMTPWGSSSNWANQSLLIHFFKENWGGEKFFQILDKMSEAPARFVELLELFYVCLSLGFMGRFHLAGAPGRQAAADLRDRLYLIIRRGRSETDRTLSNHWMGLEVDARRFKGFAVFGLVAGVGALLGLAIFAWYSYALGGLLGQLNLQQLEIKRTELSPVAMAPAAKPRLAQLLSAEVTAKKLEVRDFKLESVVTVLGETVFESGSAVPTAKAVELMQAVAKALDQVEGQIVVTGHTDNVPTRTLRYASNFALSKERATNVKSLIAGQLRDGTRIGAEGKGDTEPVTSNATAEGRAQNRRVEISLRVPSNVQ
jgi:type VI secretion system protein ImpK